MNLFNIQYDLNIMQNLACKVQYTIRLDYYAKFIDASQRQLSGNNLKKTFFKSEDIAETNIK